MMNSPVKWHGGKKFLAPWIISLFPSRDTWNLYREPYFGGGSVLFHLDSSGVGEVVNDINCDLMNFWEVLARLPDRLIRELWATPFAEPVWQEACRRMRDEDKVRRATAFFVKIRQSRQALGKCFATPTTRIRRGMNENVSAWLSAIESLPEAHERLKRVEICCMDAINFIHRYDDGKALFYCDCPYLHSTRTYKKAYDHEMTFDQHRALLECLTGIKGKFALSGYHSDLYDTFAGLHNWRLAEKVIDNKAASGKTKRRVTECLWMNY